MYRNYLSVLSQNQKEVPRFVSSHILTLAFVRDNFFVLQQSLILYCLHPPLPSDQFSFVSWFICYACYPLVTTTLVILILSVRDIRHHSVFGSTNHAHMKWNKYFRKWLTERKLFTPDGKQIHLTGDRGQLRNNIENNLYEIDSKRCSAN